MATTTYTLSTARAEIREAIKDLESGLLRLHATVRQLRTLPAHKRVQEAWGKGHEEAGSAAWWLAGACIEVIAGLEERVSDLKKDLRVTDTIAAERSKRTAERIESARGVR